MAIFERGGVDAGSASARRIVVLSAAVVVKGAS
jgi:hypothetical protein